MTWLTEQRGWLTACGVALGLATLIGGFTGPMVWVLLLVYLAGSILITFGGTTPTEEETTTEATDPDRETDDHVMADATESAAAGDSPDLEHGPDLCESDGIGGISSRIL